MVTQAAGLINKHNTLLAERQNVRMRLYHFNMQKWRIQGISRKDQPIRFQLQLRLVLFLFPNANNWRLLVYNGQQMTLRLKKVLV